MNLRRFSYICFSINHIKQIYVDIKFTTLFKKKNKKKKVKDFFLWVGGPQGHKLRQFVALTQDVAVRGYVALTSGSRAVARGARLIIFFVY